MLSHGLRYALHHHLAHTHVVALAQDRHKGAQSLTLDRGGGGAGV